MDITLIDDAEQRVLGRFVYVEKDEAVKPVMEGANLSVLAYAHGFTAWHYNADAMRDVLAAGFFDSARDLLTHGDMITVSAQDGMMTLAVRKSRSEVDVYPMSAAHFPMVA